MGRVPNHGRYRIRTEKISMGQSLEKVHAHRRDTGNSALLPSLGIMFEQLLFYFVHRFCKLTSCSVPVVVFLAPEARHHRHQGQGWKHALPFTRLLEHNWSRHENCMSRAYNNNTSGMAVQFRPASPRSDQRPAGGSYVNGSLFLVTE
jgi:hypothetical protein